MGKKGRKKRKGKNERGEEGIKGSERYTCSLRPQSEILDASLV